MKTLLRSINLMRKKVTWIFKRHLFHFWKISRHRIRRGKNLMTWMICTTNFSDSFLLLPAYVLKQTRFMFVDGKKNLFDKEWSWKTSKEGNFQKLKKYINFVISAVFFDKSLRFFCQLNQVMKILKN